MLRSIPALSAAVLHADLLTFKPPTAPALRESCLKHLDPLKKDLGLTGRDLTRPYQLPMPAVLALIPFDPMGRAAEVHPRPRLEEWSRAGLQFAKFRGYRGNIVPIPVSKVVLGFHWLIVA